MLIERPPLLWDADTEDVRLLPLLGEMIVVGLGRGNALAQITLNAANISIEQDGPRGLAAGDYVALTIKAAGDWRPEWVWPPGLGATSNIYCNVEARLAESGAVYAYSRASSGQGSLTVFFRRAY
jgi:hypothetical protein